MFHFLRIVILMILMAGPAVAQAPPAVRPTPPTRDPNTPGYVTAKELPDGTNAPANADGNFIIGPTHNPVPEMSKQEGVPQGTVFEFTMNSADSKIYPGIARETNTFGVADPTDPSKLVEKQYNVKLTKDPEGRATMGGSSGGSCAFIMAWYRPDLYRRILTYSGTYVNQQWPTNPQTPHGAWEFHEHLIPDTPAKPLRIWMEVGDRDLFNPNVMRDQMHDWVVANENMAKVLGAKGYHYQFVFARNAGHTDRAVKQQTLPEALEYIWKDYSAR